MSTLIKILVLLVFAMAIGRVTFLLVLAAIEYKHGESKKPGLRFHRLGIMLLAAQLQRSAIEIL